MIWIRKFPNIVENIEAKRLGNVKRNVIKGKQLSKLFKTELNCKLRNIKFGESDYQISNVCGK